VDILQLRLRRSAFRAGALIDPAVGFAIVALVMYSMSRNAKVLGLCWMAAGGVILLLGRLIRRPDRGSGE
jgi:hypothetical protein